MKLKLTKNRKPIGGNVTTHRRMKLINNIEKQLHSFTDDTIKVNKWYWLGEDGCYYFEVKYGKQPIELEKGMFSVQCLDESELVTNFVTIQNMIKDGQFDTQLDTLSKTIRNNFMKK